MRAKSGMQMNDLLGDSADHSSSCNVYAAFNTEFQ